MGGIACLTRHAWKRRQCLYICFLFFDNLTKNLKDVSCETNSQVLPLASVIQHNSCGLFGPGLYACFGPKRISEGFPYLVWLSFAPIDTAWHSTNLSDLSLSLSLSMFFDALEALYEASLASRVRRCTCPCRIRVVDALNFAVWIFKSLNVFKYCKISLWSQRTS